MPTTIHDAKRRIARADLRALVPLIAEMFGGSTGLFVLVAERSPMLRQP
jgi:hypothetical protein